MLPMNPCINARERDPLLGGDLEGRSELANEKTAYETLHNDAQEQRRMFTFQDIRTNIAAGMMDLSLFIANCNQLANVIRTPPGLTLTAHEKLTTFFISASIFLQVFVVVLLIWCSSDEGRAVRTNRGTVTCIFLILVINVFVACLNNEQQHYTCPLTPNTPPTNTSYYALPPSTTHP